MSVIAERPWVVRKCSRDESDVCYRRKTCLGQVADDGSYTCVLNV